MRVEEVNDQRWEDGGGKVEELKTQVLCAFKWQGVQAQDRRATTKTNK